MEEETGWQADTTLGIVTYSRHSRDGIHLQLGPEERVSYTPVGGDGPAVVDGAVVRYRNVWPGVDIELTPYQDLLKEDIVLRGPGTSFEWSFDFRLEGVRLARLDEGWGFVDLEGAPLAEITGLIATDAAGALASVSLTVEGEHTSTPRLTLALDPLWATARERVFPIRVDPTIGSLPGNQLNRDLLRVDESTLVVIAGSTVHRSTDNGATWAQVASGVLPSTQWARLALIDDRILAVGASHTELYSSVSMNDGLTWSAYSPVTTLPQGFRGLAWGQGEGGHYHLVAYGQLSTGTRNFWMVGLTTDGTTWTVGTTLSSPVRSSGGDYATIGGSHANLMTWHNGKWWFLEPGILSSNGHAHIWSSTDGLVWSDRTPVMQMSSTLLTSAGGWLTSWEGRLLAYPFGGSSVWSSVDGSAWREDRGFQTGGTCSSDGPRAYFISQVAPDGSLYSLQQNRCSSGSSYQDIRLTRVYEGPDGIEYDGNQFIVGVPTTGEGRNWSFGSNRTIDLLFGNTYLRIPLNPQPSRPRITGPVSGATLHAETATLTAISTSGSEEPYRIIWYASRDDGTSWLQIAESGPVASGTNSEAVWRTSDWPDGPTLLRAVAKDISGRTSLNSQSLPVLVTGSSVTWEGVVPHTPVQYLGYLSDGSLGVVVHTGTETLLVTSRDHGYTWTELPTGLTAIPVFATYDRYTDQLYLGVHDSNGRIWVHRYAYATTVLTVQAQRNIGTQSTTFIRFWAWAADGYLQVTYGPTINYNHAAWLLDGETLLQVAGTAVTTSFGQWTTGPYTGYSPLSGTTGLKIVAQTNANYRSALYSPAGGSWTVLYESAMARSGHVFSALDGTQYRGILTKSNGVLIAFVYRISDSDGPATLIRQYSVPTPVGVGPHINNYIDSKPYASFWVGPSGDIVFVWQDNLSLYRLAYSSATDQWTGPSEVYRHPDLKQYASHFYFPSWGSDPAEFLPILVLVGSEYRVVTVPLSAVPASKAPTITSPLEEEWVSGGPRVTWQFGPGYFGDAQSAYQVQWLTDGQVVYDSGARTSGVPAHDTPPGTLSGVGTHTVQVRTRGNSASWGPWSRPHAVLVDASPPVISAFSINSGASSVATATVSLTVTATDLGSGIRHMSLSNDGGQTWGPWIGYSRSSTHNLPGPDGSKLLAIRIRDQVGNVSDTVTRTVTLDRTAPTLSDLQIHGGAEYARTRSVAVVMTATDTTSGVAEYQYQVNSGAWSSWLPYTGSFVHSASSDGRLDLSVRVRDGAGNTSAVLTRTIMVDTVAPTGTISAPSASSGAVVHLTLSATDSSPGSGVGFVLVQIDGGAWSGLQPYTTSLPIVVPSSGEHTFAVRFVDRAGNYSPTYTAATYVTLTAVPSVSLLINGGAEVTYDRNVTLAIQASDPTTPADILVMQFSTDSIAWSSWEPFQENRSYTLPDRSGIHHIQVRVRNPGGAIGTAMAAVNFSGGSDRPTVSATVPDLALVNVNGRLALVTQSNDVTVRVTSSNADELRWRYGGSAWGEFEPLRAATQITLPAADGLATVEVQGRKAATGALSTVSVVSFVIDRTPPTVSLTWERGITATTTGSARLTITARDNITGPAEMVYQYRVDEGVWVSANTSTPTITFSDKGLHHVDVRVFDQAGVESEIQRLSIWYL